MIIIFGRLSRQLIQFGLRGILDLMTFFLDKEKRVEEKIQQSSSQGFCW